MENTMTITAAGAVIFDVRCEGEDWHREGERVYPCPSFTDHGQALVALLICQALPIWTGDVDELVGLVFEVFLNRKEFLR